VAGIQLSKKEYKKSDEFYVHRPFYEKDKMIAFL